MTVVAMILGGWEAMRAFLPVHPQSRQWRYVWVRPGESATAVANTLQRDGLIRSAWAFLLLVRWRGAATHLTSGVYRFSPRQRVGAMLTAMVRGEVVTVRVTVVPGMTVRQVVARLVADHIGSWEQYRRLLQTVLPGMPQPARAVRDPWEGYLYPATYSLRYGASPQDALKTMWQTFRARAIDRLYRAGNGHLSVVQWVTLASIIQKEDENPRDAADISAVFYNRLRIGMPLDSDATVRYALNDTTGKPLTLQALQVSSPYNTYRDRGLPPGPICIPGRVALEAALHPASVPYLYFLSLPNGHVLFATTYAEQQAHMRQARLDQTH